MNVRDAMTTAVVTVRPDQTLAEAAEAMTERNVGSAIVVEDDQQVRGILTERDVLLAVARHIDCEAATVADHVTEGLSPADPASSLSDAAAAMLRGGFRHLVVSDGDGRLLGVVSMREILRLWAAERLRPM